jgi:hypothetical protein
MKLVHKSLTPCIFSICLILLGLLASAVAQDQGKPAYIAFYNPERGFKPAQTSLTQVFLQLAGNLEHCGSPEPYIRHMQTEHKRVSTRFTEKTGKPHQSRMPLHMSDDYLERFIANWNALSPRLQLDTFSREIGRCAREGIKGTRDTGTIVINVFNEHQEFVIQNMKSGSSKGEDFEHLRSKLITELEFDKPEPTMVGYETARRDAVSYALVLEGRFDVLFKKIDAALPRGQATQVKKMVTSFFLDLCELAHSEFEIGMLSWSLE